MFITEYLKFPREVGAIAPSSIYLAEKMIKGIDFSRLNCIVEFGPGTGSFTEKILARAKEHTTILLIEINTLFYNALVQKYGHKENVIIINESAENISKILHDLDIKKVDLVISGLPFTSLPQSITNKILRRTKKILGSQGAFITFQYTMIKCKLFQTYFSNISVQRCLKNLPPAYVLNCKN